MGIYWVFFGIVYGLHLSFGGLKLSLVRFEVQALGALGSLGSWGLGILDLIV